MKKPETGTFLAKLCENETLEVGKHGQSSHGSPYSNFERPVDTILAILNFDQKGHGDRRNLTGENTQQKNQHAWQSVAETPVFEPKFPLLQETNSN